MSGLERFPEFPTGTETYTCQHCRETVQQGDMYPDGWAPPDIDDDPPTCPSCGGIGAFVRRDPAGKGRPIAKRWTEDIAKCGGVWTSNLLLEYLEELGLDALDYLILELLESYRRKGQGAGEVAWPSLDTLGEHACVHPDTVKRRLRAMRQHGLIEAREQRSRGGTYGSTGYTRHGLTVALDHIAANRRGGRPDTDDLDDLLRELWAYAKRRDRGRTTTRATDHLPLSHGASAPRGDADHGAAAPRGTATTGQQRPVDHGALAPQLAPQEAEEEKKQKKKATAQISPNGDLRAIEIAHRMDQFMSQAIEQERVLQLTLDQHKLRAAGEEAA